MVLSSDPSYVGGRGRGRGKRAHLPGRGDDSVGPGGPGQLPSIALLDLPVRTKRIM